MLPFEVRPLPSLIHLSQIALWIFLPLLVSAHLQSSSFPMSIFHIDVQCSSCLLSAADFAAAVHLFCVSESIQLLHSWFRVELWFRSTLFATSRCLLGALSSSCVPLQL